MSIDAFNKWKLSVTTQAKRQYLAAKRMCAMRPSDKASRAEVDIFAGVHNHDRALFLKGVKKWNEAIMKQFEDVENGKAIHVSKVDSGGKSTYEGTFGSADGEQAVFSFGALIKTKRNQHEKLQKQLDDPEVNWWD